LINPDEAQQVIDTWNNITAIDLGQGIHFLQETHPHEIGEGVADWYKAKVM